MVKPVKNQHEQLKALARTYVPEWRFSQQNPDVGSVTAILIDDMLSQSEARLSQVLHKHKIQYLNLFDHLKEEPIESAKTYARFSQVSGMDEPVAVPKGTRLIAENEEKGIPITFETNYGITTTCAEVVSVCTTDGNADRISRLKDTSSIGEASKGFHAFEINEENESEHLLLLGFDNALDEMDGLSLGLRFTFEEEGALDILLSDKISYSILEAEGERLFDKVERRGDSVWLTLADYIPQRVELSGAQRYVIALKAKEWVELRISSCQLFFSDSDMPADEVICGGVSQSVGKFLPFGKPMAIFSQCDIENRRVLARQGAEIEMSFDLDFEVYEQQLSQVENELDYKIIMKKPTEAPRIETMEIHADYILVEYLSTRGWRRLISDENAALLMNGSATGKVSLRFICPNDLAPASGDSHRLRIRLMRSDNLYRFPCREYCPVMRDLRFSYSYEQCRMFPNYACIRNNFTVDNITEDFKNQHSVRLFFPMETQERSMYLGFDQNPQGMPTSVYFEIENHEDVQLDYTSEYLTASGFEAITAVDNTGGMLYSGTLLMPIGGDATRANMFGRNCWWVRLRLRSKEKRSLPLIKEIITNMVQVENVNSSEEEFYISDETSPLHITLAVQNLIAIKVYVNEEDGDSKKEENWVRWNRREGFDQRGRVCDIDYTTGNIDFDRYAFAAYPVKKNAAAVKVEYQSYQGSAANVPARAISEMAELLPYIASVTNPLAAYGGYDGYNEKTGGEIISNMLRTRERAVTYQDYFDIIAQASYGVRRIKCLSGVNSLGQPDDDVITVALLIDEYDKGSHIFSSVKDNIHNKLLASGSILPLGKTLILSQPNFVRFSARIWLDCDSLDGAYDLQQQTSSDVEKFLDPLCGGFDQGGWEIGVLPTVKQLLAYLKMKRPSLTVARIAMSAQTRGQEFAVDDALSAHIGNPFAIAVSGTHTVYVQLTGR